MRYSFKLRKIEHLWDHFYGSTVLKVRLVMCAIEEGIIVTGLNNGEIKIHHFKLNEKLEF